MLCNKDATLLGYPGGVIATIKGGNSVIIIGRPGVFAFFINLQ